MLAQNATNELLEQVRDRGFKEQRKIAAGEPVDHQAILYGQNAALELARRTGNYPDTLGLMAKSGSLNIG